MNEWFYDFIFNVNSRFSFLMGGYGSSKSHSVFQKVLLKCMEQPGYRVGIVRKNFSSHKLTTFLLAKEIFGEYTRIKSNSTADIHFDNGSSILFIGANDTERLKGAGKINMFVLEELSEFNQGDVEEIMGRQRGVDNPMIVFLTNPLTTNHWMYDVLFTKSGITEYDFYEKQFMHEMVWGECYYHHSTVIHNDFVDKGYINILDKLKETNPFKYISGRKGNFGVLGDRVINNWRIEEFTEPYGANERFGLDFGFVTSYNAFVRVLLDGYKLYVTHEYFNKGQTNKDLAEDLKKTAAEGGFHLGTIYADHDPLNQYEMMQDGVVCTNAEKPKVTEGLQRLMGYEIIVHPRCKNVIADLEQLCYKEINGIKYEDKFTIDPHTVNISAVYKLHKKTGTLKCQSDLKATA